MVLALDLEDLMDLELTLTPTLMNYSTGSSEAEAKRRRGKEKREKVLASTWVASQTYSKNLQVKNQDMGEKEVKAHQSKR